MKNTLAADIRYIVPGPGKDGIGVVFHVWDGENWTDWSEAELDAKVPDWRLKLRTS